MEFEIKEIFTQYPHVWQIDNPAWARKSFFVVESPFANCQTFCFNNAKNVLKIDDEYMSKFMKLLYQNIERRQFVMDVNLEYSEEILDKFRPFTKNIVSTQYKSTNGSDMVLHLLQLNTSLLQ